MGHEFSVVGLGYAISKKGEVLDDVVASSADEVDSPVRDDLSRSRPRGVAAGEHARRRERRCRLEQQSTGERGDRFKDFVIVRCPPNLPHNEYL